VAENLIMQTSIVQSNIVDT